jgi:hypothetical protein
MKVFSRTVISFLYGVRLRSTTIQNSQHNHTFWYLLCSWSSRDKSVYLLAFVVVLLENVLILVCFTNTKHVCFWMIILDYPYTLFTRFCASWILIFELHNVAMWTYVGVFFFFGQFGVSIITACTSCSLLLYFSESLLVLPCDDGIILFFPTFIFY